jgi:hypothetical protein
MNVNNINRRRYFFAIALLGLAATNAHAINYNGRIDLVQSTGANGTSARYYIAAQSLSVFATGLNESILRDAFFRKAYVNLAYEPVQCPNGILGACGNLTVVTVHALNIP